MKIQYYKIPTKYTIDCYARSTRAFNEPSQYIKKIHGCSFIIKHDNLQ